VNDVGQFEVLSRHCPREISETAARRVSLRAEGHYYRNIRHYVASPVDKASANNLE
jgi:hypothetical protein